MVVIKQVINKKKKTWTAEANVEDPEDIHRVLKDVENKPYGGPPSPLEKCFIVVDLGPRVI